MGRAEDLLQLSCLPQARSPRLSQVEPSIRQDACRIYGPDTGGASGRLVLGRAFSGLSGCTFETIYSPRALALQEASLWLP